MKAILSILLVFTLSSSGWAQTLPGQSDEELAKIRAILATPTVPVVDLTPVLTRLDTLIDTNQQLLVVEKDTNVKVGNVAVTFASVMTFIGKFIAPSVLSAYATCKAAGKC